MTQGLLDFKWKTVLVTGATSGIGKAAALMFAKHGANVVVVDLNEMRGAETVQHIEHLGAQALFVKADISKAADAEAMVSKAVERFGRLDAALNNAGISPMQLPVDQIDEADWDKVISVDLKGCALSMKYELQHMIGNRAGVIVNMASVAGVTPEAGSAPYNAAKAGVIALTKVAAIENAHRGIRVNAVAPGWVRTEMTKSWDEAGDFNAKLVAAQPMHRGAEPDEIASAVLYLCSSLASFITGQTIVIDGGQTIRGLFPIQEDHA